MGKCGWKEKKSYICRREIIFSMMSKTATPDLIIEASWEVCNKVGGIYTVLSSRAKTLQEKFPDRILFIGPELQQDDTVFSEEEGLLAEWKQACAEKGLAVRVGRWQVPGRPISILVDFTPLYAEKNAIYAAAWTDFGVDSLKAYGDYDEASMFSEAAGRVAGVGVGLQPAGRRVVYQAHEWMSGLGMMNLKKRHPEVATIFTTHATSIGRSIAGNNKLLYKYFEGYHGDQMAAELHMDAKHSVEKQSAHHADCFTTVSTFTDRECAQLLDKAADVVLPNGFESDFVPKGSAYPVRRKTARKAVLNVASHLLGEKLSDQTLIVSTSGRNDFRCKGFDVYLEAMAELNARLKPRNSGTMVLALVEVPCWTKAPRQDLVQRLSSGVVENTALPDPIITHELFNFNEDRIVNTIRSLQLQNALGDAVKIVLVPCYLDGKDGIFNMPYYDLLLANDLCIYPSYYEPWGYTPLESCAFKIPCVTTDLSGFGQWVDNTLGHAGGLPDGVCVIRRDDDNYFEVARTIADTVEEMFEAAPAQRSAFGRAAARLAQKADWKHFIKYYYSAYDFALSRVKEEQKQENH